MIYFKKIIIILSLVFSFFLFSNEKTNEKIINLSTLEWPPYISENIENKGYVYELVVEAFKRSGYKANIKFYPWARALSNVENGKQDALFPEYYSKEREKSCVFSDPFPGGPVGLYKRKDFKIKFKYNPQKEQEKFLYSLKDYSFGIVRSYVNTKIFDKSDFLYKVVTGSDKQNLMKLNAKRVDFIFIDKLVAEYLIKTELPKLAESLEFVEPAFEIKPLYLGVSKKVKNYKVKLKAFNDGLREIKNDGTLDKILKKYKMH